MLRQITAEAEKTVFEKSYVSTRSVN